MACLNRTASEAAKRFKATAATDITGFGLAVHACEMANASNVTLEIELGKLPVLAGAMELAKLGFVTRANKTNREFSRSMLGVDATTDTALLELIFDPQTSGGLLICVPESAAADMVDQINEHQPDQARVVGRVVKRQSTSLNVS